MSDANKVFKLLIQTDAELQSLQESIKDLTTVKGAMEAVGTATEELDAQIAALNKQLGQKTIEVYTNGLKQQIEQSKAAGQETQQLEARLTAVAGGHKEAGEAAHDHGEEVQTLRQAATAAKEATYSYDAFLRGDYVTALHEAKFATVGLYSAVEANPWSLAIAASTLAIPAIAGLASTISAAMADAQEYGKATADAGGKIEETGEKAKTADERWQALGRTTRSTFDAQATLVTKFEAETAALEKAKKPLDDIVKSYEKLRAVKDELLDAQSQVEIANIEGFETAGEISPEEGRRRRANVRLRDETRRVDTEEESVRGPLNASDIDRATADRVREQREAQLQGARSSYASALSNVLSEQPGFRPNDQNLDDRAAIARKNAENMQANRETLIAQGREFGSSQEDVDAGIAGAERFAQAMSQLATADAKVLELEKKVVAARTDATQKAKLYDQQLAEAAPKLEVLVQKRKVLEVQTQTEAQQSENADKAQQAAAEQQATTDNKADVEARRRQQRANNATALSKGADPEQIARSNARIDYQEASEIEDPQEKARRQQEIVARERSRRIAVDPFQFALDQATNASRDQAAQGGENTVIGGNARASLSALSQARAVGSNEDTDNALISLLQKQLDGSKGSAQDRSALMAAIQALHAAIDNLQRQRETDRAQLQRIADQQKNR